MAPLIISYQGSIIPEFPIGSSAGIERALRIPGVDGVYVTAIPLIDGSPVIFNDPYGEIFGVNNSEVSSLLPREFGAKVRARNAPNHHPPFFEQVIRVLAANADKKLFVRIKAHENAILQRDFLQKVKELVGNYDVQPRITIVVYSHPKTQSLAAWAKDQGFALALIDPRPKNIRQHALNRQVQAIITGWVTPWEQFLFFAHLPFLNLRRQAAHTRQGGVGLFLGVVDNSFLARALDKYCKPDGFITRQPVKLQKYLEA